MTHQNLPTNPASGPVGVPGPDASPQGGSLLLDAAPDAPIAEQGSPAEATAARHGGRPARQGAAPGSSLSFGGVLRSERIKLLSLRSVKITLLLTLAMGIGLAGLMGFAGLEMVQAQGGADPSPTVLQMYLLTVSTFAAPFLAMVFGVLGVFSVTSEYSSGMILSTLAAAPRRGQVFVAKALVLSAIAAVVAFIIAAVGLLIAVIYFPASASQILTWEVLSGILGTVVYQVLIALLAFGIAALLRSTAGGISAIVGLIFVLPIGFQVLMITGWAWIETAMQYLPLPLGSSLSSGFSGETVPSYGIAALTMAIWTAVALVPAFFSFRRRDAK
ncbi:ABC transporter permease subunit [Leucobacter sp. CSA2]|uniref:ABC transporter permease subunit n=1 Tax=Leucobacter edaphi TaxID=2796472 RepID=A0A934UXA5_9MICO|nr:ABC transporter permease [Leucobacter edaphi]MBK0421113.1 ABC transporter permease subunit [Leucobacter edaphi]